MKKLNYKTSRLYLCYSQKTKTYQVVTQTRWTNAQQIIARNKQLTTNIQNNDVNFIEIDLSLDLLPSGKTRAWKFGPNVFISKLLTA